MLDPIKTIMVGDDLTKNEIDFVAFQEVQSKQERIQDLGLGFAVAKRHKENIVSFKIFLERVKKRGKAQALWADWASTDQESKMGGVAV